MWLGFGLMHQSINKYTWSSSSTYTYPWKIFPVTFMLVSSNPLMNGQATCIKCTAHCSWRDNLKELDALSHVRDFICGDWRGGSRRQWEHSHTRGVRGLGERGRQVWDTLVHIHTYHRSQFFHHTHTRSLQVPADSAQYLGGYIGEGGTLRDAFCYLQSFYPQGSKHQLLLGRTHREWGLMDFGRGRDRVAAQGWESKGKTYRNLSWAHTPAAVHISHTAKLSRSRLQTATWVWRKRKQE